MKKKLFFILIALVLSSCLYAVSFGYGYSMEGFSGFNQSSSSRLNFALDLTDSRYLTVEGGAGLGFRGWKMLFTGFNLDLSMRTFSLTDHIFSFMFANPVIWSPKASAGILWDDSWDFSWRFGLSVLNFVDVHFNYEFLRPFVMFDPDFDYCGWGMDLIRITYYL